MMNEHIIPYNTIRCKQTKGGLTFVVINNHIISKNLIAKTKLTRRKFDNIYHNELDE